MSNPPHDGGTGDVPVNDPSGRPRPPANPGPGRPQQPGRPAPGAPQTRPAGTSQPGRQPQSQVGTQRQPVTPRPGVPPRTTGSHGRLPAAQQRQPIDLATRLDGQRGWLAQIDESLKKRSIVAL